MLELIAVLVLGAVVGYFYYATSDRFGDRRFDQYLKAYERTHGIKHHTDHQKIVHAIVRIASGVLLITVLLLVVVMIIP